MIRKLLFIYTDSYLIIDSRKFCVTIKWYIVDLQPLLFDQYVYGILEYSASIHKNICSLLTNEWRALVWGVSLVNYALKSPPNTKYCDAVLLQISLTSLRTSIYSNRELHNPCHMAYTC